MDSNSIGNRRQHDDNMIAVANAARLSECWRQLVDNYSYAALNHSDYVPEQIELYRKLSVHLDPEEKNRWIKVSIMSDKAISCLQTAITSGRLSVWCIHNAREILLTPLILEKQNVQYGLYKSYQRPEPEMQGAKLWVKDSDWQNFLLAVTPRLARKPGRPNKRNEAIQLHKNRLQSGTTSQTTAGESQAIHSILAESHKGEPGWSYDVNSIAKALRNFQKGGN